MARSSAGDLVTHQQTAISRVQELEANSNAAQFRAKSDLKNEKIGLKIRRAQLEKIPFMVVIGDKEAEDGMLSVRNRFEGDIGSMSYEQFLSLIQGLKTTRAVKP
jgi:threonyl-tRNA synthetase